MFNLTDDDLRQRIVGIGDGPASFNAEMNGLGLRVVSVDPLYVLSVEDIAKQFFRVVDDIIDQVRASPDDWTWCYHKSPAGLKANRIEALRKFAGDYENGQHDGRYVRGELPSLDFDNDSFDIALCSHFLLLYCDRYSYEFHRASVCEMLRIASEARIFPILSLALERSPHLRLLVEEFNARGFCVQIERVQYELQRGGNEMLRIKRVCDRQTEPTQRA
ncbi:MAG: SAM-dependent methyltransferase [Gammaproteobacteria bacterium]